MVGISLAVTGVVVPAADVGDEPIGLAPAGAQAGEAAVAEVPSGWIAEPVGREHRGVVSPPEEEVEQGLSERGVQALAEARLAEPGLDPRGMEIELVGEPGEDGAAGGAHQG